MTERIYQMAISLRREMIAWAIAGAALHISVKHGFSKWSLAALGMAVGIGMKIRRRKRQAQ